MIERRCKSKNEDGIYWKYAEIIVIVDERKVVNK